MIVLTTTKEKSAEIELKFSDLNFYHFPCIEYTAPRDEYKAIDAAIRTNHLYEWVFFLSQKAAEVYFERLLAIGGNFFNLSNHLKFAVIGKATKEFLENEINMPIDFVPSQANSDCFIKEFTQKFHYDFDCAFKVLLPRSELACDDFKEKLEASKNYELDIVPAYNTISPIKSNLELIELREKLPDIKTIVFMSTSCVQNFSKLAVSLDFSDKTFYSIGVKTTQAIKEHFPGHESIVESAKAELESIFDYAAQNTNRI